MNTDEKEAWLNEHGVFTTHGWREFPPLYTGEWMSHNRMVIITSVDVDPVGDLYDRIKESLFERINKITEIRNK